MLGHVLFLREMQKPISNENPNEAEGRTIEAPSPALLQSISTLVRNLFMKWFLLMLN